MATLYCEFEDPKKYREAVTLARRRQSEMRAPLEIIVAPPRIFKLGEEWMLKQVRSCEADGYLVRNYDHLRYFANDRRIGDYSFNIANRLAAEYLSYAHARAEAAGAISGGLTDFSPPGSGYFLLDHYQTQTLHAGFHWSFPGRVTAGGDASYGSGFTDGSAAIPAHLPGHTTFDLSLSKDLGERLNLSVTALNLANRRFLLDNSETFGGTHYAEPRQIYVQLRYRFHW